MADAKKIRLDQLLVERGLAESRERAQRLIRAGLVWLGEPPREVRGEKPGGTVAPDAVVNVRGDDCAYVSRGGLKLEGALREFQDRGSRVEGRLVLEGINALDIGASTGGFTDCLLQHGVGHVWAFDSGHNQLHEKIKVDARVTWREGANARELDKDWVGGTAIDLCVIDVSFISLRLILPGVLGVLAEGASVIALVKPQFEAGAAEVGRGGVVRDEKVHRRVLRELAAWCGANGWRVVDMCASPLRGPAGNVEFFFWLRPGIGPDAGPDAGAGLAGVDLDNAIERVLGEAYSLKGA